jgi:predicted GIY-YIG superfamily endonuclease
MRSRKTVPYTLRQGNKIVYVGITNDLVDRESQHRGNGKRFDSLRPEGSKHTRESARQWEKDRLETFRNNHKGQNPQYNKDADG